MSGEGFGFPSNWSEEDRATHGEMLARCGNPGCHSPLELYLGLTLVVERCAFSRHLQHAQSIFPEAFAEG